MMKVKILGKKSEILGLLEIPCLICLLGNDFISVPQFTVERSYSNWIMILRRYL